MPALNYNYDKKRFETFIDAVVAIILTILVLELRVPEGEHTEGLGTRQQLALLLPSFVSYVGSFLLIVGIWIDHHLLFLNIEGITKRYIVLNMLFILSLSVVPFTTAFAGSHHRDPFAVALLFASYVIMNLLFSALYLYARSARLLPAEFVADNRRTALYATTGIAGLIAAVPLAYVSTYLSFGLGIAIFAGHLLRKR
jgi:uncharacterized membrane protein